MQDKEKNSDSSKSSPSGGNPEGKGGSIEIRSDEVQEIMGTPPKWIVQWGIVIILLVVIVLLSGSYFYKYPDIIEARVTIVSENPPIPIVARSDGRLDRIFVADKQKVEAGELLGIIENPANYKDVYSLKQFLDSIQPLFANPETFNDIQFKQDYQLGQNHSLYSSFISQLKDFQTFVRYNSFDPIYLSRNIFAEETFKILN